MASMRSVASTIFYDEARYPLVADPAGHVVGRQQGHEGERCSRVHRCSGNRVPDSAHEGAGDWLIGKSFPQEEEAGVALDGVHHAFHHDTCSRDTFTLRLEEAMTLHFQPWACLSPASWQVWLWERGLNTLRLSTSFLSPP